MIDLNLRPLASCISYNMKLGVLGIPETNIKPYAIFIMIFSKNLEQLPDQNSMRVKMMFFHY